MKAVTKIFLYDRDGEKFFGEGPARLLHGIEETGSLRAAAISMNMAYTKALKLLKNAESALGFPLTARTAGGKSGGGSQLTPEGKVWLMQYEKYREACIESNRKLMRKFFPRVGCVIMASGMGKRFGSNKLMAYFDGKPMIWKALQATEGLFEQRVVVTRHEEVARLCEEMGILVVFHDLPCRNDTVRLGLEALGDMDGCLFASADQPLLSRETVNKMVMEWSENQQYIMRPVCNEVPGSPVLFPEWAFSELKTLPEGKGGGWVMKNHPEKVRLFPVENPYELMDADTPEDLQMLQQYKKEGEYYPIKSRE